MSCVSDPVPNIIVKTDVASDFQISDYVEKKKVNTVCIEIQIL